MLKIDTKLISVNEYFTQEDDAVQKSEYFDGEVFAMAGGTLNHNRITINLVSLLNAKFQGKKCEVFASDLKIQVKKDYHFTYPDVSVVCGEPEFYEERKDTICNPIVIIEVLSDSTMNYDRGSKFSAYRSIKTLTDYILVEQNTVHIELFYNEQDQKSNNRVWSLKEYFDKENILYINSIRTQLLLEEIYKRVVF